MKNQLFLGLAAAAILYAQADNTKITQRDRESGAVTADDQKMNKEDRELAQKIRKSVDDDKTLLTTHPSRTGFGTSC